MRTHRLSRLLLGSLAVLALTSHALSQDDVTDVAPLTVTGIPQLGLEVRLPDVGGGATNLSVEQTASIVCEAQRTGRPSLGAAQLAHDATVAARESRRRAARGEPAGGLAELELARQRAVIDLTKTPRPQVPAGAAGPVRILDVKHEMRVEDGQRYLFAVGSVWNPTRNVAEVPAITVHMLDLGGYVIGSQSVVLEIERLAPDERRTFEVRLRNPALYTNSIQLRRAPPMFRRTHRDCEYFEPAVFDPRRPTVELIGPTSGTARLAPVPAVGEGAPYYTASELAEIESILRRSVGTDAVNPGSEAAKRSAQLVGGCTLADIGMDWRSLMRRADLAGEAWYATRAAEEVRREIALGDGEVLEPLAKETEFKRQAAVRALMAAAPTSKESASGFLLSAAIGPGAGKDDLHIDVVYENRGANQTLAGPTMLALVDRFGVIHRADVLVGLVGVPGRGKAKIEAGWRKAPAPDFLLQPGPGFRRDVLFAPCGPRPK